MVDSGRSATPATHAYRDLTCTLAGGCVINTTTPCRDRSPRLSGTLSGSTTTSVVNLPHPQNVTSVVSTMAGLRFYLSVADTNKGNLILGSGAPKRAEPTAGVWPPDRGRISYTESACLLAGAWPELFDGWDTEAVSAAGRAIGLTPVQVKRDGRNLWGYEHTNVLNALTQRDPSPDDPAHSDDDGPDNREVADG